MRMPIETKGDKPKSPPVMGKKGKRPKPTGKPPAPTPPPPKQK